MHEGVSCVQPAAAGAPVFMCVCVFPDCPGVTSAGLQHLEYLVGLKILILRGFLVSFISGQDGQKDPGGWIRGLPDSLQKLDVIGELR